MEKQNKEYLDKIRHSCAHLLAAAVLKLWPEAKPTIGPFIENGFYYDFDFGGAKISEEDLEKIQIAMGDVLLKWGRGWKGFERIEVSVKEARERFKNNPYKLEIIDDLEKRSEIITLYKSGDFVDLCRGGHVDDLPKIRLYKLVSIAGAYWRGDEKNPMLTRIYGTCFPTQKELDEYLQNLEKAKKRDHRKIGKELDLFSFHDEAPGFVFWHPKGMVLREALMSLHSGLHREAGYQQVSTPILLSEELWHRSGHWDNYKDKMYFTKVDNKVFAIKPMNCPGVSLIYKNHPRSYKDLPLRLAEAGEVHRNELSGTLHGLFRVRAFRQDDAHIFVREDQIEEEVKNIIKLTLKFYEMLGFSDIKIELSTRPEKYIGTDRVWEEAEKILKKVLQTLKLEYKVNAGEGAFYGPKIDFHIKDVLGRFWQCGTIQLDFFMPERFGLEYIDNDGQPKHPIMIHRTVIGSIQRFVGILIEHFGGAFPLWLCPVQVVIIPITDKQLTYAKSVYHELITHNLRSTLDDRAATMQAKIRDATLQKVPYQVIIGDREIKKKLISVRIRAGDDLGPMSITDFIKKLEKEIDQKV